MRFKPTLISRKDHLERQKRDITAHALKIVASIQRRAGLKKDRKQAREFMKIVDTITKKIIEEEWTRVATRGLEMFDQAVSDKWDKNSNIVNRQ